MPNALITAFYKIQAFLSKFSKASWKRKEKNNDLWQSLTFYQASSLYKKEILNSHGNYCGTDRPAVVGNMALSFGFWPIRLQMVSHTPQSSVTEEQLYVCCLKCPWVSIGSGHIAKATPNALLFSLVSYSWCFCPCRLQNSDFMDMENDHQWLSEKRHYLSSELWPNIYIQLSQTV